MSLTTSLNITIYKTHTDTVKIFTVCFLINCMFINLEGEDGLQQQTETYEIGSFHCGGVG